MFLFTSAVGDRIVPVSSLQTMEARGAHQLVAVATAENDLTTHQEVAALSETKIWRAGVFTLHRLWGNAIKVTNSRIRKVIKSF